MGLLERPFSRVAGCPKLNGPFPLLNGPFSGLDGPFSPDASMGRFPLESPLETAHEEKGH